MVNIVVPPPPSDPRLGRYPDFDERSRDYPIRTMVEGLPLRSYTWSKFVQLNQGPVGACVGFSIAHEINARPKPLPSTHQLAMDIYMSAKLIDPWPGEAYEGTSVLAGIKDAARRGYFAEYRWAFGLNDLLLAVGYKGPAVIGINWYQGMMQPDAKGFIHPTGSSMGGHAILLNQVKVSEEWVFLPNSWGNWGIPQTAGQVPHGCKLSFTDLERLLKEDGDAVIPTIRTVPL